MSGEHNELHGAEEAECVFNELDDHFSDKEISEQIHNLKKDKAPGIDCLLNEMFIKCENIFLPILTKLFNHILSTGLYPEEWSKGIVVPIYMKGDGSDAGNYRPITLISHLAKLFTSVLNRRLLKWCETNNCLTDAQFGFRPGHSTCDAIFALHSLIVEYLSKKKKLYCCFVDYQKAFDSVDHVQLWRRLVKLGITGKLLNVIRSMYQQIKSCVRFKEETSDFYTCFKGLVQGEALSPLIFSLFVNDIELDLIHDCNTIQLNEINLFLLMYADDTVLFAESSEDLQKMMDALLYWTREYKLTVNVDKTKVVIFRPSWQIENVSFYFNGNLVEIVNNFSYLGMLFNYNGKFNVTQKHIAAQGKKALFCLMKEVQKHNFNVPTLLSLFDTYVSPVLNYCSEIWGYMKAQEIEKIHTMFLKRLLGVKRSTSNDMIYSETGRLPLIVNRKFNMLKYWLKLTRTENCVLKNIYEMTLRSCNHQNNKNWSAEIRDILISIGLVDVWQQQRVENERLFLYLAKQSLKDLAYQKIDSFINNSNKCILYKHVLKNDRLVQSYLKQGIPAKYKKYISKFRLSAHSLKVETGRYDATARENRLCTMCNLEDIEDEYHFILKCPYYTDIRNLHINTYFTTRPSVYKLTKLFSSSNKKILCNLGKYLLKASERKITNG